MTRIALIGGGRIGEALLSGLIGSGHAAKNLVVSEKVPQRAEELRERYGVRIADVADAVEGADVAVVAVKPGDVDGVLPVLAEVAEDSEREQLVVSMVAGLQAARFEAQLAAGTPVVRVMPNTPMLVGQGACAIAPGRYAHAEHLERAREILASVGAVQIVTEQQLDAVTAVSGSGPAYFFLVVDAMVDAAVGLGLSRQVASDLAVQTIVGAGAMLAESGESPTELRAAVTSPGGTTAAAIRALERGGLRAAFYDALGAAHDRSVQMASE